MCGPQTPGGHARRSGRPGRRRRRAPLDGARAGRPGGRGSRRPDRRAVDAALAPGRTTRTDLRAGSTAASILVMIYRGDYWQCAFVIAKGGVRRDPAAGPASLSRGDRGDSPRSCATGLHELRDWDDIKLLTVASIACARGTGRACSASAMRRTRCRRSAASASTWPSRTPWPRPTSWRRVPPERDPARRSARGPAPARAPDPGNAAPPGLDPEPGDRPRARKHRRSSPSIAFEVIGRFGVPAPDSRPA